MNDKRRSFFGWGYEGNTISAEELSWFERAWSKLFQVDNFEAVPMPRDHLAPPASVTGLKFEALLHRREIRTSAAFLRPVGP
jgi:hypothetical protein